MARSGTEMMFPRPGRVSCDLKFDICRPRQWTGTHDDKNYQRDVRHIREIFEGRRVLVELQ